MTSYPSWNASLYKDVSVRVVVGITCTLSLLGALLIILSYCLFKDLRTTVRLILVHLSIMDMGSALAHLIGVSVYFDRFYISHSSDGSIIFRNVSAQVDNLCRAQAFCSAYFNYGAFLWTASLAVYLYFRIVHLGAHQAKYIFWLSFVFSYLTPFPLVVWLLVQRYIGYSPYGAGGWCGLKIINPYTLERNVFVTAIGYDLLQDTTLILAGVLFVSVHLHIRHELALNTSLTPRKNVLFVGIMWFCLFNNSKEFISSERFWGAFHKVDYKLLLIPVVFIILRLPSCFISITYIYTNLSQAFPVWLHKALVYLEGIGDSSQGLANAVLFVVFTSKVREKLNPSYWKKRRIGTHPPEYAPLVKEKAEYADSERDRRQSETLSITPYSSLA